MKRAPSIKRLMEAFSIDAKRAGLVRSLIKREPGTRTWDRNLFPESNRYFDRCRIAPRYSERVLHCLNEVLGMHGVEVITRDGNVVAKYLNSGDTYTPTLMRINGRFQIASVGDYAERNRVD